MDTMQWTEKYKDRWFNLESDTQCTACVAPWMDGSGWFVSNLVGGDVSGFKTAEEAMRFVDAHPELFPNGGACVTDTESDQNESKYGRPIGL